MSCKRPLMIEQMDEEPPPIKTRAESQHETMDSQETVDYNMDIEPSTSALSKPPDLKRIISVERDAKQIAEMLNIPDNIGDITSALVKNRDMTNRMEIVTNQILENGIESAQEEKSDATKKTPNKPQTNGRPSKNSDDFIEAIFIKMCKAYKKIKPQEHSVSPRCDLNELFQLVEENIENRQCVDIVVEQISKSGSKVNGFQSLYPSIQELKTSLNESQEKGQTTKLKETDGNKNRAVDNGQKEGEVDTPVPNKDTRIVEVAAHKDTDTSSTVTKDSGKKDDLQEEAMQQEEDIITEDDNEIMVVKEVKATCTAPKPFKLRSVFSDAHTLMQKYPKADPNKIYALLESMKDDEDRLDKVHEKLTKESAEGAVGGAVEGRAGGDNALMKETDDLAAIFPHKDRAEIYAYLEAHHNNPNRVQLVTNELLATVQDSQGNTLEDDIKSSAQRETASPALGNVIDAAQLGSLQLLERDVETLRGIFPEADPMYLYDQLQRAGDDPGRVGQISAQMTEHSYPRLKERLEKAAREKEKERIRDMHFNMEEFVSKYPDPATTFNDETKQMSDTYKEHVKIYLSNTFPFLVSGYINKVLETHKFHLTATLKELEPVSRRYNVQRTDHGTSPRSKRFRRNPRNQNPMPEEPHELFYNELMYINHQEAIKAHLDDVEERKKARLEAAKEEGILEECNCCFDEEVLPEDMEPCPSNHRFCRDCVRRGAEAAIGQGKAVLECMAGNCPTPISMDTLQKVLADKTFALLLRKIQEEEIAAAGIEGLESCPFCSYSAILLDVKSKVFQCNNPDCMKESCRECKEASHIPLRCDEVEGQGEGDMRKFIENRMTEAMIRTCHKCKKRFYKTEGCNKMTCTCGASMCYVCRKPITGYDHFNAGNECSNMSDVFTMHHDEMSRAAQDAKRQYEEAHPEHAGTSLKHDPMQHLKPEVGGEGAAFRFRRNEGYGLRARVLGAFPLPFRQQRQHPLPLPFGVYQCMNRDSDQRIAPMRNPVDQIEQRPERRQPEYRRLDRYWAQLFREQRQQHNEPQQLRQHQEEELGQEQNQQGEQRQPLQEGVQQIGPQPDQQQEQELNQAKPSQPVKETEQQKQEQLWVLPWRQGVLRLQQHGQEQQQRMEERQQRMGEQQQREEGQLQQAEGQQWEQDRQQRIQRFQLRGQQYGHVQNQQRQPLKPRQGRQWHQEEQEWQKRIQRFQLKGQQYGQVRNQKRQPLKPGLEPVKQTDETQLRQQPLTIHLEPNIRQLHGPAQQDRTEATRWQSQPIDPRQVPQQQRPTPAIRWPQHTAGPAQVQQRIPEAEMVDLVRDDTDDSDEDTWERDEDDEDDDEPDIIFC